jgi:hypothetical protein
MIKSGENYVDGVMSKKCKNKQTKKKKKFLKMPKNQFILLSSDQILLKLICKKLIPLKSRRSD